MTKEQVEKAIELRDEISNLRGEMGLLDRIVNEMANEYRDNLQLGYGEYEDLLMVDIPENLMDEVVGQIRTLFEAQLAALEAEFAAL